MQLKEKYVAKQRLEMSEKYSVEIFYLLFFFISADFMTRKSVFCIMRSEEVVYVVEMTLAPEAVSINIIPNLKPG